MNAKEAWRTRMDLEAGILSLVVELYILLFLVELSNGCSFAFSICLPVRGLIRVPKEHDRCPDVDASTSIAMTDHS